MSPSVNAGAGAPLIGVTAAYGVYLSLREDPDSLDRVCRALAATDLRR